MPVLRRPVEPARGKRTLPRVPPTEILIQRGAVDVRFWHKEQWRDKSAPEVDRMIKGDLFPLGQRSTVYVDEALCLRRCLTSDLLSGGPLPLACELGFMRCVKIAGR